MRKLIKRSFFIIVCLFFVTAVVIAVNNKFYNLKIEDTKGDDLFTEVVHIEPEPAPEPEPIVIPIDFAALQAGNPDIYAWINIPNTLVDYPILQSSEEQEEDYYLDTTVEGDPGYPGSIYTQKNSAKDFTDKNTVIYGHNMNDDSMFGSLHNFENLDFFNENRTVTIYTPEKILTYEIFAAIVYDDRLITDSFDFNDSESYQAFLDSVYSSEDPLNHYNEDAYITPDDTIITLVTCIGNRKTNRYLVLAVLRDVQQ